MLRAIIMQHYITTCRRSGGSSIKISFDTQRGACKSASRLILRTFDLHHSVCLRSAQDPNLRAHHAGEREKKRKERKSYNNVSVT